MPTTMNDNITLSSGDNSLKKIIFFLLICFFCFLSPAHAKKAGGNNGIGIIFPDPTGLSLRFGNFPVLGIGWTFDHYVQAFCDYWILHEHFAAPSLFYYIGVGAKMGMYEDYHDNHNDKDNDNYHDDHELNLGLRIPFGLQYIIQRVELFGEIVPGIALYPATDIDIDGGIGVRILF
jgi:hypothetical protein